jgi:hypothetical protein
MKQTKLKELMPLIQEQLDAGGTVRFLPQGTSMLPMLRQGIDSVTLTSVPEKLKKYDLPLYQRDNGSYVLHRIVKAGESYSCIGDNQFVLETGVRHDQMLAVVTSFTRKGRQIPVTSLTYQIYCRFWHYSRPMRHFWRRGTGWLRRQFHK